MLQSPPSRRRGLKYIVATHHLPLLYVASFSEAWIEISITINPGLATGSPPSRRRGLKLIKGV